MKRLITPTVAVTLSLLLTFSCTGTTENACLVQNDSTLDIRVGDRTLLSYVHAPDIPRDSIDPVFTRSGFIHPIYSPGGEVLTAIRPVDHLHHFGIWNPWTSTRIRGEEVDFWNLGKQQGTVRFSELLEEITEPSRAGMRLSQEHLIFHPPGHENGSEEVAIEEVWEIKAGDLKDDRYIIDLSSTFSTPLQGGILLEQYHYGGGLAYRATGRWGKGNCTMLSSDGHSRNDLDNTPARWTIIEGESSVPQGRSGILFLAHPANHNSPEMVRMWQEDSHDGSSNVFFNLCPVRKGEWKLAKGQKYSLRYRMIVFDGSISPEEAWKYYREYALKPGDHMFRIHKARVPEEIAEKMLRINPNFVLKLQKDLPEGEKTPLLIWLHGGNGSVEASGSDQPMSGLHFKYISEKYPLSLLFPQTMGAGWDGAGMKVLVDYILENYPVDPDRIYLAGGSMGGAGTWLVADHCPEYFAALLPCMGGGLNRKEILGTVDFERLKKLPSWSFAGGVDKVTPIEYVLEIDSLLKELGAEPKLSIYENMGHGGPVQEALENEEVYKWLLSHKRSANK